MYHRSSIAVMSLVAGSLLLIMACGSGDDSPGYADPYANTAGQGPSSTLAQCRSYCEALVKQAKGCEHYNDGDRCESICGYYFKGACSDEWNAYVECMTNEVHASCFQPDNGKLTLVVEGCESTFTPWHECREEKHAAPCPYE